MLEPINGSPRELEPTSGSGSESLNCIEVELLRSEIANGAQHSPVVPKHFSAGSLGHACKKLAGLSQAQQETM